MVSLQATKSSTQSSPSGWNRSIFTPSIISRGKLSTVRILIPTVVTPVPTTSWNLRRIGSVFVLLLHSTQRGMPHCRQKQWRKNPTMSQMSEGGRGGYRNRWQKFQDRMRNGTWIWIVSVVRHRRCTLASCMHYIRKWTLSRSCRLAPESESRRKQLHTDSCRYK